MQAKLKQKGVQINEVDGAPFRKLVDPVYARFGKEWGAEYVEKVRKAASGS